ncbi:MAG: class I SAM-dependent methyltransferase, partial [Deltaproteobacteria bacterium]|nr:class I SAM-dependent methyltransferase [Deltaproteobacteria bacterium]
TCASGAVSYETLASLLVQAGFAVQYSRDHLGALKSLAARLVWEYGSLENLSRLWPGDGLGCLGIKGLTYGLVIARAD